MEKRYIGLDIGGTKCAAVIGDEAGNILQRIAFASGREKAPDEILTAYFDAIDTLLETHTHGTPPLAIGISCGGPLDAKRGVIQRPPNLPLWDDVAICDIMTQRYGCPAFLQNDANACAIAEWKFGAGRGSSNMAFLTFGTGLGAGLILNGKLYEGTNGMAGEIGHLRLAPDGPTGYGKRGSFEGFCSGGGIRQLAMQTVQAAYDAGETVVFWGKERDLESISAKDVCIAARQGDTVAMSIIEQSASYLGKGLAILLDVLNPQCIVIGSIFARAEDLFRPVMDEYIRQEALEQCAQVCRIVPAQLGDRIGDVASLSVAMAGLEQ